MNILILNWRDIKNPASGGAEILTFEMAKYWVKWGNSVTWFSSIFPNCEAREKIEGIEFIRRGLPDPRAGLNSVYVQAYLLYKKQFKGEYDVIIDEIHGLPFFTPIYVKEKKIAFICELGGILWNMFGPVNAFLGRAIEKIYTKYLYKNILFLTISPSTKAELITYGIIDNNIAVIPMGITVPEKMKPYLKEKKPTIIFIARLTKAKGIEDAIYALKLIKKDIPNISLWVIGRGNEEYTESIKQLVQKIGVVKNVRFFGFVSEHKKFELLSKAHLLIVPSIKEGWGLTVAEAGVTGTPSVTYNASGLRDVLKNNTAGMVTRENTPEQLASATIGLLSDKEKYGEYLRKIKTFNKQIGWETTAKFALKKLQS